MKRMFKIMFVFISLFMFSNRVLAKKPTPLWNYHFKENNNSYLFTSIDTYDSENFYVGGINSESEVSINSTYSISNAGYKGMVAKYDKDGRIIWNKIVDGVRNIYKVKGTSDGGFVALGENITKPDGSDFTHSTLFKYDKDGNVEWKTELETTSYFTLYFDTDIYCFNAEIYIDSNGNYIVVLGQNKMNIVVISSDGKINRNFNTDSLNEEDNTSLGFLSSTMDSDNYIVLFGGKYSNNSDTGEIVMYKFDTNGYLVSNKDIGSVNVLSDISVDTDINGNYVMFLDTSDNNDLHSYSFNVYDRNGKLVSSKPFDMDVNLNYASTIFKLKIDLENNYFLNYYSNGYFEQCSFNQNGEYYWQYLNGASYAFDFTIDKYNNYFYVGGDNGISPNSLNNSDVISTYTSTSNIYSKVAYIEKYKTDYNVDALKEGVGEVESSISTATVGDIVTIKATPGEGYRIDKITVTDKFGNNIEVVDNKFIMPASDVTIKVVFTNAPVDNPKTGIMNYAGVFISLIVFGIVGYRYIKSKSMIEL